MVCGGSLPFKCVGSWMSGGPGYWVPEWAGLLGAGMGTQAQRLYSVQKPAGECLPLPPGDGTFNAADRYYLIHFEEEPYCFFSKLQSRAVVVNVLDVD